MNAPTGTFDELYTIVVSNLTHPISILSPYKISRISWNDRAADNLQVRCFPDFVLVIREFTFAG